MATGTSRSVVILWDTDSGLALRCLGSAHGTVDTVAFSPDGKTLLGVQGYIHDLRLWDTRSGALLHKLPVPVDPTILDIIRYSPDGKTVAAVGDLGDIYIWDAHTGLLLHYLKFKHNLGGLDYSPDGQSIIVGGDKFAARIWDVASGKLLHTLGTDANDASLGGDYSKDGKVVLTQNPNGPTFWDAHTATRLGTFQHGEPAVYSSDFKTFLVYTANGDQAVLWDVKQNKPIVTIADRSIYAAAFSPDSKILFGMSYVPNSDRAINVWDAQTGVMLKTLSDPAQCEGEYGNGYDVVFSPDGSKVLVGCVASSQFAEVWDVKTGVLLHMLPLPG